MTAARLQRRTGQVFWITGMSGVGKTTLGKELTRRLNKRDTNTVFLDGDVLRSILSDHSDYSPDGRMRLAMIYARMCKELADQGFNVVCSTISNFAECRTWNRQNNIFYIEIYVHAPMKVLVKRDTKGLYTQAMKGIIRNVIGIDIPFLKPENPDFEIENGGQRTPEEIIDEIMAAVYPKRKVDT